MMLLIRAIDALRDTTKLHVAAGPWSHVHANLQSYHKQITTAQLRQLVCNLHHQRRYEHGQPMCLDLAKKLIVRHRQSQDSKLAILSMSRGTSCQT